MRECNLKEFSNIMSGRCKCLVALAFTELLISYMTEKITGAPALICTAAQVNAKCVNGSLHLILLLASLGFRIVPQVKKCLSKAGGTFPWNDVVLMAYGEAPNTG